MKAMIAVLATALGLTLAAVRSPPTPRPPKLAKNSGCVACHGIDKKISRPGVQGRRREIQQRQRRRSASWARKVKAGGKGNWGDIPMPPNAHVKDADIKAIVHWVLSLK